MIPPLFGLDNLPVRVRTEVWRAPGLEIRIDVKSDGSRELHEGNGEKIAI
jgi:hypothetical protein